MAVIMYIVMSLIIVQFLSDQSLEWNENIYLQYNFDGNYITGREYFYELFLLRNIGRRYFSLFGEYDDDNGAVRVVGTTPPPASVQDAFLYLNSVYSFLAMTKCGYIFK